ncbi:hypothetical protein AAE478_006390 [Parahypoxylon ruwenzoriense]
MTESVSLRILVDGVEHACESIANTIIDLGRSVTAARASILPLAAECLTTKAVLEKLGSILATREPIRVNTESETDTGRIDGLEACFEVLVHSISEVLLDVDHEITRLRRYPARGDPLAASKYVPVLHDLFVDAKIGLRRNRSSLCLMLDCLQRSVVYFSLITIHVEELIRRTFSGNLLEATIQLLEQSSLTQLSPNKPAAPSRLQPVLTIELPKLSDKPDIRRLLVKYRPKGTGSVETKPKLIRKLHDAITKCDHNAVHKCLATKVDPNAQLEQCGIVPIHRALDWVEASLASDNKVAARVSALIVTALVIAGADLKALDENGRTPLIRAAINEMPSSLISLMLEFGASVNAKDRQRNTSIHHAATKAPSDEMANIDIIQVLLVHGADQSLRNKRGRTPLHEAISFERFDRAQELLDYGANLEMADNNGWTPLFGAVAQGSAALAKLVCDRGAVVDKKDKNGQSALRYAISQGCKEVVEVLLSAGADVNLIIKGETPLCQAASKSNSSLLGLLLTHGADVTLPSPRYCGALPIHIAAMGNDLAILDMLLEAGSPINAVDDERRTPLRWAIDSRKNELVHFLFSKGAAK